MIDFFMKFKLYLIVFVFSLFLQSALAAPAVTLGFLPGADVEVTKKGAALIAQGLQDQLGSSVNVYISKDYASLLAAMKAHKVDFAFLTAMTFVESENDVGLKVLLKKVWENPFYYSVILSSGLKAKKPSLKDLKGKKIAFVDENSTSGYLYPKAFLKKQNLAQDYFSAQVFSGSHVNSVHMLEQKQVDAIAVFADDTNGQQTAFTKFSTVKNKMKTQLIWVSEPIPNDPFCVRQDFYDKNPKLTHDLMFALIDIFEKLKDKKEVLETIGAKGLMLATQKQYDVVRDLVKTLDLLRRP